MHPVFMPRNEEEIMRHIWSLSAQIKYLRDIPQVVINFDEQTHTHLFFTVVLVRVATPGSSSIQDMFRNSDTFMEYIHDRCKTVGFLRKKYTKESTVFRVKLLKQQQFLRKDNAIDLYRARQAVTLELLRILGEFRDFNGGMISKQNELLAEVRNLLINEPRYNDLLLENFFYSLAPVIMRTVLESEALKQLFSMQLKAMDAPFTDGENSSIDFFTNSSFVYAMIKSEQRTIRDEIVKTLSKFPIDSSELANSYVQVNHLHYIGYIYRCDDTVKKEQFVDSLQTLIYP